MSRSLSQLQALVLGVAVLLALGLSAVGLFAVGSRQWPLGNSFTVSVGFANIRGIEEGTRVRIQGMDAGEVTRVDLPEQPGQNVLLRLRLDGRFRHLLCSDASAQIVSDNMMGGKVVEIEPGESNQPLAVDAVLTSRSSPELNDLVGQGANVLKGVGDGKGTVGKLMRDDEAYRELVALLRQSRAAMTSIRQDADAIKSLPVVRSYVTDARKELDRPECECNRQWFRGEELFPPGRAVLTAQGQEKLDGIVPWLEGLKHKGSEVVVATYAAPDGDADSLRNLTLKQSEAVCTYLTQHHKVQKMGWFSWSRKVTAVGCGTDLPPDANKEKQPLPRVEVLVFVPQK